MVGAAAAVIPAMGKARASSVAEIQHPPNALLPSRFLEGNGEHPIITSIMDN